MKNLLTVYEGSIVHNNLSASQQVTFLGAVPALQKLVLSLDCAFLLWSSGSFIFSGSCER